MSPSSRRDWLALDLKDKAIVEQLQKDARLSIAQIARKTKLPRDVVVYRIKKLEQSGVIRAHHTQLDHRKLGYPLYVYVLFSCYNTSPQQEKSFVGYLTSHKRIVYVAKNSGKYDFTMGVCAKDYLEFDELLRGIRQRFPDLIKDIEALPTIEEYKFDWMADLIEVEK